MSGLLKRLRREVTADPKKGVLLGVMVLVGLYFWAPLVAGWVGGERSPPSPSTPGASSTSTPSTAGAKTGENKAGEQGWYLLSEWMQKDPRKQSVGPAADGRDPFRPPEDLVKKEQEKPEPPKKIITPENLTLALTGTVLGPGGRVALLNGKSYREGDNVEITREGQSIVLKLVGIGPQSAVLVQDGRRLELKISRSPLAAGIKVVGGTEH